MTTKQLLSDEERLNWLRLSQTENVGPATFQSLLAIYRTATAAIEALPSLSVKGGRRKPLAVLPKQIAEEMFVRAAFLQAQFVVAGEAGYPPDLVHIPQAPVILCVRGNLELAKQKSVGVVGARNASALGLKLTRQLARGLVDAGFTVVSGLARGIDTAAHEAAMAKNTIAVLAGGLDYFYPPENEALQRAIAEYGLLVSEMPPGTVPKSEYFPRRNRIISGMSKAIIIVEAAMRSGSLITARFAAEQGREVFAVPGSPLDPRCEGTNKLIRDGANILTSLDDVLEALEAPLMLQQGMLLEPAAKHETIRSDIATADRNRIMELLSPSPIEIDDLIRESHLPSHHVTTILLELELAGRAMRHAGGRVSSVA
ncbi:MAG: DNA-processing protein DprA [Alphaproteobacteria bacterium]|nr:DNA-processing protein DprA [Alphaproteobacteria bacterium]